MTGPRPSPDSELERRLSALLQDRASLAPDAGEVRAAARATGAARQRRRRRTGAGVALGVVGLAAVAVPFAEDLAGGLVTALSPHPSTPGASATPSAPAPSAGEGARTGAVPWTVPADGAWVPTGGRDSAVAWDQDDVDAFNAAGYTYDDAVALAELWQHPGDTTYAKVHGGEQLLEGTRLPVTPGSSPARTEQVQMAWDTFARSGLSVHDALALAELWGLPSGYQGAVAAGTDLMAGEPLPEGLGDGEGVGAGATPDGPTEQDVAAARAAWRAAGHDAADAAALARLWSLPDAAEAELAGGSTLLAGQPLPDLP